MTTGVLVRERRTIVKTLWGAVVPGDIHSGAFTGLANVYGIVDEQRDLLRNGVFAKSARQKGAGLPVGWEHDLSHPAGVVLSAAEVGTDGLPQAVRQQFPDATGGLAIEGQLTLTRLNRARMKAVRDANVALGLSAKFDALVERPLAGRPDVQEVLEGALEEVSFTIDPANLASVVTVMKSRGEQRRRQLFPAATAPAPSAAEPAAPASGAASGASTIARRLAYVDALLRTPLN